MSSAMLDVPRCVPVGTVYVGAPRVLFDSRAVRRTAWSGSRTTADDTAAWRRSAVLQCLDTASILRGYREPAAGEAWTAPAASERRLLAQVDAVLALGAESLACVSERALDPDVPDPGRVFAALLILGCVEDTQWLWRARDLFVAAVLRDPGERAAAIEAASLSAHPDAASAFMPLLDHDRASVRAAALRVLGFRETLPESRWREALSAREPAVVAAALGAPLRDYDLAACERLLSPLMEAGDSEPLTRAALRAGVSLRLAGARRCAAWIARSGTPGWADATHCLAMFGNLGDAPLIRSVLHGAHPQAGVQAAGVLGSVELVPDLLGLIGQRDMAEEAAGPIRDALTTITGLPFDASCDASQARQRWTRSRERFVPQVRYRHGRPLTLDGLLRTLRAEAGSRTLRQNAYLEMRSATQSRVPRFSAYDFVGAQHESLRRIERWIGELPPSVRSSLPRSP